MPLEITCLPDMLSYLCNPILIPSWKQELISSANSYFLLLPVDLQEWTIKNLVLQNVCFLAEALLWNIRSSKKGNNLASEAVEVTVGCATPTSTPWFLRLWILAIGWKAPLISHWLRRYTASWRTLPQTHKVLFICYSINPWNSHFTTLPNYLLQNGGEHAETSEFHEHGPASAFHFPEMISIIKTNTAHNTMMLAKELWSPLMIILMEEFHFK